MITKKAGTPIGVLPLKKGWDTVPLDSRRLTKLDRGFTLIELVMVIVVIGILAAAALPRFSSLNSQALLSAHQKFAGDFKSAIGIVHAAWIAAGMPNTGGNGTTVVILEGVWINVSAPTSGTGGWPYGWNNLANPDSGGCKSTITQLLNNPPEVETSAGNCTQTICYVSVATYSSVSPFFPLCTFTLNGTSHTIAYDTGTGAAVVN